MITIREVTRKMNYSDGYFSIFNNCAVYMYTSCTLTNDCDQELLSLPLSRSCLFPRLVSSQFLRKRMIIKTRSRRSSNSMFSRNRFCQAISSPVVAPLPPFASVAALDHNNNKPVFYATSDSLARGKKFAS